MKKILFITLLSLFLCSCDKPQKNVDTEMAREVEDALISEFRKHFEIERTGGSGGGGGQVTSKYMRINIPDDNFDIYKVSDIAKQAIDLWGKHKSYVPQGESYGSHSNSYKFNFGNKNSHLFCIVLAHYDVESKKNVLNIFINLVQETN